MSGTSEGKPFACEGVDVIAVSDGFIARKDTTSIGLPCSGNSTWN